MGSAIPDWFIGLPYGELYSRNGDDGKRVHELRGMVTKVRHRIKTEKCFINQRDS